MNFKTRFYLGLYDATGAALETLNFVGGVAANSFRSISLAGKVGIATVAVAEGAKLLGAPISTKDAFSYAGYVLVGLPVPVGFIRSVHTEYQNYKDWQKRKPPAPHP